MVWITERDVWVNRGVNFVVKARDNKTRNVWALLKYHWVTTSLCKSDPSTFPTPLFPRLSQFLSHPLSPQCLLGSFVSNRLELLEFLHWWFSVSVFSLFLHFPLNITCLLALISLFAPTLLNPFSAPLTVFSFFVPALLSLVSSLTQFFFFFFFFSTVSSPGAAVGRWLPLSAANLSNLSLSNRNLNWTELLILYWDTKHEHFLYAHYYSSSFPCFLVSFSFCSLCIPNPLIFYSITPPKYFFIPGLGRSHSSSFSSLLSSMLLFLFFVEASLLT